MTEDQKKVILDYATELRYSVNDEPWREFEYQGPSLTYWMPCSYDINPMDFQRLGGFTFRRKPRTITVTMPVPNDVTPLTHSAGYYYITTKYKTESDRDTALAAIREAMGVGNE